MTVTVNPVRRCRSAALLTRRESVRSRSSSSVSANESSSTGRGRGGGESNGAIQQQQQQQRRRRRKKNKYAGYSKVEQLEMDPLEKLVAESKEKNRLLDEEKQQTSRLGRQKTYGYRFSAVIQSINAAAAAANDPADDDIHPLPAMSFPDNSNVDPYDPTTFGYNALGSIVAAHGVRGWVKVRSSQAASNSFPVHSRSSLLAEAGARLHLKPPNKRAPRPVRLVSGRHCVGDEYLCWLDGSTTRDDALKLRGSTLFSRHEDETWLQQQQSQQARNNQTIEESYSVSELVGLAVYLQEPSHDNSTVAASDGSSQCNGHAPLVGTVGGVVFGEDISDLPLGYDMLEIIVSSRGAGKVEERVMIPLVPQLVPVIDTARGEVYIDPPSGLLDLRYVREERVRIKGFLPPSSSP
jgi:ribosomal 30S subunit maturation factor RimM